MTDRAPIIIKFDMLKASKSASSIKRFVGYLSHREGAGGRTVYDPQRPAHALYTKPKHSRDRWRDHGLGANTNTIYDTLTERSGQSVRAWSVVISLDSGVADQFVPEDQASFLQDLTAHIIEAGREKRRLGELAYASIYHWKTNSRGDAQPHTHVIIAGQHVDEETGLRRDFVNFQKGTSKHFDIWREVAEQQLDDAMIDYGIPDWRDKMGPERGSVEEHRQLLQRMQADRPTLDTLVAEITRRTAEKAIREPIPSRVDLPTPDEVFEPEPVGLSEPEINEQTPPASVTLVQANEPLEDAFDSPDFDWCGTVEDDAVYGFAVVSKSDEGDVLMVAKLWDAGGRLQIQRAKIGRFDSTSTADERAAIVERWNIDAQNNLDETMTAAERLWRLSGGVGDFLTEGPANAFTLPNSVEPDEPDVESDEPTFDFGL